MQHNATSSGKYSLGAKTRLSPHSSVLGDVRGSVMFGQDPFARQAATAAAAAPASPPRSQLDEMCDAIDSPLNKFRDKVKVESLQELHDNLYRGEARLKTVAEAEHDLERKSQLRSLQLRDGGEKAYIMIARYERYISLLKEQQQQQHAEKLRRRQEQHACSPTRARQQQQQHPPNGEQQAHKSKQWLAAVGCCRCCRCCMRARCVRSGCCAPVSAGLLLQQALQWAGKSVPPLLVGHHGSATICRPFPCFYELQAFSNQEEARTAAGPSPPGPALQEPAPGLPGSRQVVPKPQQPLTGSRDFRGLGAALPAAVSTLMLPGCAEPALCCRCILASRHAARPGGWRVAFCLWASHARSAQLTPTPACWRFPRSAVRPGLPSGTTNC